MSASFRVVIPARLASQRLHEKMLADVAGKPLVVRTWERACLSDASEVIVATDDIRVADAVEAHGAQAVLTDAHPTGTDRVAQVASLRVWQPADIVVNVQGDEPLISPADINAVAALLRECSLSAAVATLCTPLQKHERDTASVVKVVGQDRAHWFSRAALPGAHRHIGVYAWRVAGLHWFREQPRTFYERVEMLEQLRVLESGMPVALAPAPNGTSISVDTLDDLTRVRYLIGG